MYNRMDTLDPFDPTPEHDVRRTTLLTSMALFLAVGAAASAAEFDRSRVAADAKWIAHIDLDAVKAATLAEKVRDRWLAAPAVKQRLAAVKLLTGVDLMRDLHGVTFYGSRLVQKTGVVIVHADFDGPRLLDIVRNKPDFESAQYGDHTLHTWTERKETPGEHTVTGSVFSANLLVVGRDIAEVKAALDVLGGKSAALEGSGSSLAHDVPEGAVAIVGVIDLAKAKIPFKSPIVNQSEMFWAAFGQRSAEVFAELTFVAKSDEAAGQVEDILRGLRAMALLQHGSDEEAKKLIENLSITTSQRTVQVEWHGAAGGVWRLIEQVSQKR